MTPPKLPKILRGYFGNIINMIDISARIIAVWWKFAQALIVLVRPRDEQAGSRALRHSPENPWC